MKLLFDHNLSLRLVRILADLYPNSQHVFLLEMDREVMRILCCPSLPLDRTTTRSD